MTVTLYYLKIRQCDLLFIIPHGFNGSLKFLALKKRFTTTSKNV